MRWNIAPESISLVILGIIWVYARKGSPLPSLKNKVFQGCLMVTFSAMLTNILSTLMIYQYDRIPLVLTWIITSIYFVLTPLMGLAYFLYTIMVIFEEPEKKKRLIGIGMIPGVLYALLVLVNPFVKNLFDINREQGYIRGPLISVTYIIFYLYCFASILVTVVNYKRIERKIYVILAAFPILAVLVIIVQQMYPDIILSGSAATCALLIIYLHLQNKQISLDYLTSVPNRHELLDMLGLMVRRAPEKKFVLMVISLREFRQINNNCGQQVGDKLLKSICLYLRKIGPRENVYRFGGDEFALLFTKVDEQEIKTCVSSILQRMKQSWEIDDYRFVLNSVIGVIQHENKEETVEKIIHAIEYAVFQAKTGKYGQVCYCDKAMLEKMERRREVIKILKEKLDNQSFEMYYQPIYSVEDNAFRYAESLMRIPHSFIGPIYPSEFIPIAEETGLIIDITYVILEKVCKFFNSLQADKIQIDAIHVNFSGIQFSRPDLAKRVIEIIKSNHTPMSAIKIEFTESTLAESTEVVTQFALEMLEHGIKMGLDDFGTGYSNFATVIGIPFGAIKLDRSLVVVSSKNQKSACAVRNIARTFKELGMKVVAEGVETEEQKELIVGFGVDEIQGYYYAKPMPAEEFKMFMQQQKQ